MRRFGATAIPTGATICRDANTNAAIAVRGETALRCGSFRSGCSLAERPLEVSQRDAGGHWDADLMLFSDPGGVLLVAQERALRVLFIQHGT